MAKTVEQIKKELLKIKIKELKQIAEKLQIYDLYCLCYKIGDRICDEGRILRHGEKGKITPLGKWHDEYADVWVRPYEDFWKDLGE